MGTTGKDKIYLALYLEAKRNGFQILHQFVENGIIRIIYKIPSA